MAKEKKAETTEERAIRLGIIPAPKVKVKKEDAEEHDAEAEKE